MMLDMLCCLMRYKVGCTDAQGWLASAGYKSTSCTLGDLCCTLWTGGFLGLALSSTDGATRAARLAWTLHDSGVKACRYRDVAVLDPHAEHMLAQCELLKLRAAAPPTAHTAEVSMIPLHGSESQFLRVCAYARMYSYVRLGICLDVTHMHTRTDSE
jgi:hypothetical protein